MTFRCLPLVAALGLLCLSTARLGAQEPAVLTIDETTVVNAGFFGFGVELDPMVLNENNRRRGVTDADWLLLTARLRAMDLPIVRVMSQVGWFATGPDTFDYDSPQARSVLAHLDFCQENGIEVVLTDWAWPRLCRWRTSHDDPAFARAMAAYLKHLIEDRGYTCIRYLVIGNEPDNEIRDVDRYARMYHNVHEALVEAGIRSKLQMMGPDIGGRWDWFDAAAPKIADVVDAYDFHRYAKTSEMTETGEDNIHTNLTRFRPVVNAIDPAGADKPLLLTEMGMGQGTTNTHERIETPEYALHMGDYAIAVLNADIKAGIAWCAFDVYYFDHNQFMTWGLWRYKDRQWSPKPWYAVWRRVVAEAPRGSDALRVEGTTNRLHAVAIRPPGSEGRILRLWVANRSDETAPLTVRLPRGARWQVEGIHHTAEGIVDWELPPADGDEVVLPPVPPQSWNSILFRADAP